MEWDNVYYTRMGAELEAGSFRGPVLTGEQWMVLSAVHGSEEAAHRVWLNGAERDAEAYDGLLALDGSFDLGRFAQPGYANHYLSGSVAEVLVYDRALSTADRQAIEGYLSSKYAIAVQSPGELPTATVAGSIVFQTAQAGYIRVLACTNPASWDTDLTACVDVYADYALTNLPVPGAYDLRAWMDSNANGVRESWEAHGAYAGNPLELTGDAAGIDVTLTDPDTDMDGMPDWWEIANFGNLDQEPWDDFNDDGLVNFLEYVMGTDPGSADSDGDGIPDAQEGFMLDLDPLDPDTDGDGLDDYWELEYGYNYLSIDPADEAGRWRFDETEGTVAADSSTNANDGVVLGAEHVLSLVRYGLKFDGQDDEVRVTNAPAYKPADGLTLAVRGRFDARYGTAVTNGAQDGFMVLAAQPNAGGGYGYALYKTARNSLAFELSNAAETNATVVETADDFVVTGAWLHAVGAYDGTNMILYVNGEPVASAPHASPLEYSADEGLVFGCGGLTADGRFEGALDEVLVLSAALEADRVASLQDTSRDDDGDGLLNWQESLFSNPWLADSDGDGLDDYQELYVVATDPMVADSDGDGISDYEEVAVWGTNPTAPDSDMDGLSDLWETAYGYDATAIAPSHLAGFWHLDEESGTIAYDSTANGNAGLVEGASHVDGRLGGALRFDGLDDALTIADSPVYKPQHLTVDLNVSFDARYGNAVTNGAGDGYMLLLAQPNASGGYGYALYKDEHNALVFEMASSTTVTRVKTADDFVVTGGWYHVLGAYDGTNATLYVNDQLIDSTAHAAALEYASDAGLTAGGGGPGADGRLAGRLDEIRIHDVAVDAAAALSLSDPYRDDDGDGIVNIDEAAYGTDGRSADTDGDGIADNVELFEHGTDPLTADSDLDGMTDDWELAHGLDPDSAADASSDADGDGLTNLEEFETGSDPNLQDTDGDGLDDAAEVETYGTNPTSADTDGDGMDDAWEAANGTNPTTSDGSADPDGDGLINARESLLSQRLDASAS